MPFVDYDLIFEDEQPLSVCENFITPQTELISAYSIYATLPKEKNISSYEHFKRCCEYKELQIQKNFLIICLPLIILSPTATVIFATSA